jgi:crotonobetainyl-CoA:carnitine CoA-transferase CaiB-like acyl-CoA transferase
LLSHLRVIDLGADVATAFATKLMAALGADVIKVEPPEGDPTRRLDSIDPGNPDASILFAYLNTGKRSVVIDSETEVGRERLRALLEGADLIVESGAPGSWLARGVNFATLMDGRQALVVCSVTPFGQDGPRALWRTTALTALAAGGQLYLTGDPDREPLKTAGHQAYYQAGLHAFAASMTALFAARRTGIGDRIDISIQEAQAAGLEGFGPAAMVRGSEASRAGNQARAVWGIYECLDGYVGIASMARQSPSVFRCIGHPEFADQPEFNNLLLHPENNELVSALVGEWVSERTAQQVYDDSDAFRAPFSMIPTPRELLEWPPLVESGFWREVVHPVLGRHSLPALPFAIDGDRGVSVRAPLLGEHTRQVLDGLREIQAPTALPGSADPLLSGITVLDLTQVWAGPYATRFLADMGADVIHVEGPTFPDAVRGAARPGEARAFDKSTYFNEYNRNKRGLAIDLHHPDGMAAFKRMVAKADVVIENWSVGVSEHLGIGYEDLRAINPGIVMVQMPAFSREGPEASRVGFGPTIEQMGGLVALQGYEGGPPHKSGISYGDPVGGIAAAGAVATALLRRESTGLGGHIVMHQRDNVINLVGEFMLAESIGRPLATRTSNRHPEFAPHNIYRAKDEPGRFGLNLPGDPVQEHTDAWLAIAIDSDAAWLGLCEIVGDARLSIGAWRTQFGRKRDEAEIDSILANWVGERLAGESASKLQAAGISAVPVLSPLMLAEDGHLVERGFFQTVVHQEAGEYVTTGPVWRLSRRALGQMRPAPCFGEHNEGVLRTLAGCTDAEIAAMGKAGVIASEPR